MRVNLQIRSKAMNSEQKRQLKKKINKNRAVRHSGCGQSGFVDYRGLHRDDHCGLMNGDGNPWIALYVSGFSALIVGVITLAYAFATAAV